MCIHSFHLSSLSKQCWGAISVRVCERRAWGPHWTRQRWTLNTAGEWVKPHQIDLNKDYLSMSPHIKSRYAFIASQNAMEVRVCSSAMTVCASRHDYSSPDVPSVHGDARRCPKAARVSRVVPIASESAAFFPMTKITNKLYFEKPCIRKQDV